MPQSLFGSPYSPSKKSRVSFGACDVHLHGHRTFRDWQSLGERAAPCRRLPGSAPAKRLGPDQQRHLELQRNHRLVITTCEVGPAVPLKLHPTATRATTGRTAACCYTASKTADAPSARAVRTKGAGKPLFFLCRRGSVESRAKRDFAAPEMINLPLMAGRDCVCTSNFGVPPDV